MMILGYTAAGSITPNDQLNDVFTLISTNS
jgi:hypothetical protein